MHKQVRYSLWVKIPKFQVRCSVLSSWRHFLKAWYQTYYPIVFWQIPAVPCPQFLLQPTNPSRNMIIPFNYREKLWCGKSLFTQKREGFYSLGQDNEGTSQGTHVQIGSLGGGHPELPHLLCHHLLPVLFSSPHCRMGIVQPVCSALWESLGQPLYSLIPLTAFLHPASGFSDICSDPSTLTLCAH